MVNEARASKDARVAAVAEYERTIGPTRRWNEVTECPKCEVPRQHFGMKYCAGMNGNDPPDVRKAWVEKGGCPMDGEHVHVMCPRCNFGWHEFCADDDRNRHPIITS